MSHFLVDDIDSGKGIILEPARYKLEMGLKHFGQWHVAFNVPLTEDIVRTILFLRDQGMHLTVTSPEKDYRADLMAFLALNNVFTYGMKKCSFAERNLLLRHVASRSPHMVVDYDFELTSYCVSQYEQSSEFLYATIDTSIGTLWPPFLKGTSFEEVVVLSNTEACKSLDKLGLNSGYLLFKAINAYVSSNTAKYRSGRVYQYDLDDDTYYA